MVEEYFYTAHSKKTYIDFLYENKFNLEKAPIRSFFLKLLSCPVCFAAWVSICCGISTSTIGYTGVYFFSSILISSITNFILKKISLFI